MSSSDGVDRAVCSSHGSGALNLSVSIESQVNGKLLEFGVAIVIRQIESDGLVKLVNRLAIDLYRVGSLNCSWNGMFI